MELRTDRCVLRPFRAADATSVARHANSREIWLNLRDLFPHPYTVADAESYIGRVADEMPVTRFAVDVDGDAVGSVSQAISITGPRTNRTETAEAHPDRPRQ